MPADSIGLLGGTFDPIHNAHILMALAARDALGLKRVLIIPAGDPPHKSALASAEERLAMTRAAVAGTPGLEVCDAEIARQGTTYTVDTLRQISAQNPGARLVYIIGGDTVVELARWRDFPTVARLTEFAVFARAGGPEIGGAMRELSEQFGAVFHELDAAIPPVSSTRVRASIRGGLSCADIPVSVADIIVLRGLYREQWERPRIVEWLQERLDAGRIAHTIGVEATARAIAASFGVDAERAALAALIHDCAKYPACDKLEMAERYDLDVDELEREKPGLLHGRVGADLAREIFAVRDECVLRAVRWHVTGAAGMDVLGLCLCVADFSEPGRTFPEADDVRTAVSHGVCQAFLAVQRLKIGYSLSQGGVFHPRSVEAWNDVVRRKSVLEEAKP